MKKISYATLLLTAAISTSLTHSAIATTTTTAPKTSALNKLTDTIKNTATNIKQTVTGKKTDKPLSATQPGTTAVKIAGPLACDRGTAIRKDGKPCVPPCNETGENPFDGTTNCLKPTKLQQIGTKAQDGLKTATELYQYNEQQVVDNLQEKKDRLKEGDKVKRTLDNVQTDGTADDLGIF